MIEKLMNGAVSVLDGQVTIVDEGAIASPAMDSLVYTAVFGDEDSRDNARWLIWEIAQQMGAIPSSIHNLYLARGRGETGGYTVPPNKIPPLQYNVERSIFQNAINMKAV